MPITEKLELTFDGTPPPTTSFDVFAFSPNGKLLARSTAKGGAAQLGNIDASSRLFVTASGAIDARETPTMLQLRGKHAYEPVLSQLNGAIKVLPVPDPVWRKLTEVCTCRVRGRVVAPPNRPIPFVRVHVMEIDFHSIFDRLPLRELFRLRDDLLQIPPNPNPPDPMRFFESTVTTRMQPLLAESIAPAMTTLPAETVAALRTDSEALVRSTLVVNAKSMLPWLCQIHWFWGYYTQDELAVVETNIDGRFDAYIGGCSFDVPDLYFWVEAWIGGSWQTVYRPSIGCHTYWNYQCDHEVTITIDDPRVVPARPTPVVLEGVEVIRLGNQYIPSIDQSTGLLPDDTPFGGTVSPVVSFADMTGAATHYRWQYRRLTNADGTAAIDGWHDLTAEVQHHYRERREISAIDVIDRIKPFRLGPVGPNNLYAIPPLSAQSLAAPGFTAWWVAYTNPGDEVSGYFESAAGGTAASPVAGKFELRLQLFNGVAADGTGGNVVASAPANDPFSIPENAGPDDTVNAVTPPAGMLETDAAGNVVAFRTSIFVDNAKCFAAINPAKVGNASSDTCGMLHGVGGGMAEISFVASQPRNFATVSFALRRGSAAPENVAGNVADARLGPALPDPTGYDRSGTTFTRTQDVTSLLGTCVGGAAFAEQVYVAAKATNGYSRLIELDAQTFAPFAIIP